MRFYREVLDDQESATEPAAAVAAAGAAPSWHGRAAIMFTKSQPPERVQRQSLLPGQYKQWSLQERKH